MMWAMLKGNAWMELYPCTGTYDTLQLQYVQYKGISGTHAATINIMDRSLMIHRTPCNSGKLFWRLCENVNGSRQGEYASTFPYSNKW